MVRNSALAFLLLKIVPIKYYVNPVCSCRVQMQPLQEAEIWTASEYSASDLSGHIFTPDYSDHS